MTEAIGEPTQAGADAASVHARLLRDRSLQFDFTIPRPLKPVHFPDWLRTLSDLMHQLFGGALPAFRIIFWVGVGGAALAVVWILLRETLAIRFALRRARRAARPAPVDWRPDPRRARALLENADRLAARGRFDQAARLILRRGIEDIEDRRPRLVGPALTARNIADLEALPVPAKAAFARMTAIVESSAFAGQPLDESEFARCRGAYEAFAFPDNWR